MELHAVAARWLVNSIAHHSKIWKGTEHRSTKPEQSYKEFQESGQNI